MMYMTQLLDVTAAFTTLTSLILFGSSLIKSTIVDAKRSLHCRILVTVSSITVILILYG